MDKTFRTRTELKQEVKSLYRGHWGQAIKLNIIPIVLRILVVLLLGGVGLFFIAQGFDFSGGSYSSGTHSSSGSSTIGSFVMGLVTTGIAFTSLDWLRTKEADFNVLRGAFAVFSKRYLLGVFVVQLLSNIFIVLWTCLLVIPGLIKQYSYSQASYLFKDSVDSNPEGNINYLDCITRSRVLMQGHKFRLFVLQLSFLGWDILATLTCGIGYIWLTPYKTATYAAFYNDLVA